MQLQGVWASKDEKIKLEVLEQIEADYRITIDMPVAGTVEGVLKSGEMANLKFEVNDKAVFAYLFVERIDDVTIQIHATGRSSGRFQGNIPQTLLFLQN